MDVQDLLHPTSLCSQSAKSAVITTHAAELSSFRLAFSLLPSLLSHPQTDDVFPTTLLLCTQITSLLLSAAGAQLQSPSEIFLAFISQADSIPMFTFLFLFMCILLSVAIFDRRLLRICYSVLMILSLFF